MRECDSRRTPRRVQGRWAIEQRLRRLLIQTVRFGEQRANDSDRRWACRVADGLGLALRGEGNDVARG
jgi:hypothetical protein